MNEDWFEGRLQCGAILLRPSRRRNEVGLRRNYPAEPFFAVSRMFLRSHTRVLHVDWRSITKLTGRQKFGRSGGRLRRPRRGIQQIAPQLALFVPFGFVDNVAQLILGDCGKGCDVRAYYLFLDLCPPSVSRYKFKKHLHLFRFMLYVHCTYE